MKHRLATIAVIAAALVAAAPASAQRASLAERVSALESQAANNSGNVDLLNQVTALRSEIQALRSQIEELQRQNEQLESSGRSQYLDLDGRLNRLESGGAGAAPALPATAPGGAAQAPATPADEAPVVFGDAGLLAGTGDERGAYEAAFAELKAGRYADSARAFQQFLQAHPGGSYAPNAMYWLGESYYVTQNYELALQQFEALVQRYPTHDKAPGALLKVGLSQYGLKDLVAAEATLSQVTAQFPGTDAARTAEDRLRAIQLNSLR